jgi:hypothetical protein
MILFILNLCIPIIIYFQLLSQNLYPILLVITGKHVDQIETNVNFSEFSYSYTCIIVMLILIGLTLIKNLSIFVKMNTFGVVFVTMIIIFVVGVGIYALTNTNFVIQTTA